VRMEDAVPQPRSPRTKRAQNPANSLNEAINEDKVIDLKWMMSSGRLLLTVYQDGLLRLICSRSSARD
jgi:hypothetical protein